MPAPPRPSATPFSSTSDFRPQTAAARAVLALLLVMVAGSAGTAAIASTRREASAAAEKGVSAYLAGRYIEALPELEKAREGMPATGPLLYMLAYCYGEVRHDSAASAAAYDEALKTLESEVAGKKPTLESYFYLSNLHLNRRETDASRKVAGEAVASIRKRRLKVGKDGTSQFRAGKLHADAGDTAESLVYFERALAAFDHQKDPPPAYVARAKTALSASSPQPKGTEPGSVTTAAVTESRASSPAMPRDETWTRGIAALREGRFEAARETFSGMRGEEGGQHDDGVYAAAIASMARDLKEAGTAIPSKTSDGKVIADLSAEEVQTRLRESGPRAFGVLNREVKDGDYEVLPPRHPKGKSRVSPARALAKEIGEIQGEFVALAIGLLLRGSSLQEHAFKDGYAPLVMQDWTQLWRNGHRALIDEVHRREATARS